MKIREMIAKFIEQDGAPDEKARAICGFLSCECGLDNGNGWYDDDPEMAEGGLDDAEAAWLAGVAAAREAASDENGAAT